MPFRLNVRAVRKGEAIRRKIAIRAAEDLSERMQRPWRHLASLAARCRCWRAPHFLVGAKGCSRILQSQQVTALRASVE